MAMDNETYIDDEEAEIDLTPMLDVTFIMLIFFIVTAVFVKEPGVDVTRPVASTAITPSAASIFVAITPESQIYIDGSVVEPAAVRAEIERLRSENPEGGLVIQSDRDARNELLIAVMDAAKQAGVQEVTIAAGKE